MSLSRGGNNGKRAKCYHVPCKIECRPIGWTHNCDVPFLYSFTIKPALQCGGFDALLFHHPFDCVPKAETKLSWRCGGNLTSPSWAIAIDRDLSLLCGGGDIVVIIIHDGRKKHASLYFYQTIFGSDGYGMFSAVVSRVFGASNGPAEICRLFSGLAIDSAPTRYQYVLFRSVANAFCW